MFLIGKDLVSQGFSTKTEDRFQVPGGSVAKLSWQSFAKETIPRVGELNSRGAIEKNDMLRNHDVNMFNYAFFSNCILVSYCFLTSSFMIIISVLSLAGFIPMSVLEFWFRIPKQRSSHRFHTFSNPCKYWEQL